MTYQHNGITVEYDRSIPTVHIVAAGREYDAFLQGDEAAEFMDYALAVADSHFGESRSLNEVVCELAVDYLP